MFVSFAKASLQDNPLRKWIDDREDYLEELIRLEGRGEHQSDLCQCGKGKAEVRCRDCYGGQLLCQKCVVQTHYTNPFHRIEVRFRFSHSFIIPLMLLQRWNGAYFEHGSLKSLGLRLQLGHVLGEQCTNPKPVPADDFVVVDINGVQEVGLVYCGCEQASSFPRQLLRARLFPATAVAPKTASTFAALEFFHLLTFESKSSVFEFWNTLKRRTDNTGTVDIPVSPISC